MSNTEFLNIEGLHPRTSISAIVATLLDHSRLRKDQVGKIQLFQRCSARVELLHLDSEQRPSLLENWEATVISGKSPYFWFESAISKNEAVHFAKLRQALLSESEAEQRQHQVTIEREKLNGLTLDDWESYTGGKLYCHFTKSNGQAIDMPWRKGAPLELLVGQKTVAKGILDQIKPKQLQVIIDADTKILDELKGDLQLVPAETQVTHERRWLGLNRIQGSGRDYIKHYLDPQPNTTSKSSDQISTATHLNKLQRQAFQLAVNENSPIAIIHGPPGTGKSTVLLEVLRQLVKDGRKVLVTANSNSAVDHLLSKCQDWSTTLFRMGHPARVSPELHHLLLDAIIEERLDGPSLKALKKQTDLCKKQLTKGGLPKAEFIALKNEIKNLHQERILLENRAQTQIWEEAQLVFCTNTGLSANYLGGKSFDILVMDEAAQCIEPDAWIPLAHAKRVVMAGDPQQLSAVIHSSHNSLLSTSLMERWMKVGCPSVTLTQQYRMSQELCAFPSQQFYDGALHSDESIENQSIHDLEGAPCESDLTPFMFIDTTGCDHEETSSDQSLMNMGEVEFTRQWCQKLLDMGILARDIGIIAPYRAQAVAIRNVLPMPELEVHTIDGFQGREKEVIIFSTVRSNKDIGFLKDAHRLNVALTRAKRHLCVIGDSAALMNAAHFSALINHAEHTDAYRSIWEFVG